MLNVMPVAEIKYIPDADGEEQKRSRRHNDDIRLFYFKTTIAILAVALVTVTAILIWQVFIRNDRACSKVKSAASVIVQKTSTSESKDCKTKCQPMIRKNSLPFIVPKQVSNILENIRDNLKQKVVDNILVSMSCSAFYKDQTIWKAEFGMIDKSSFPQETPDEYTLYRTGSLVKLLTTLMTFKLLQDAKINCLDDPFYKYAPKFSVKNPFNNDAITIRQLLSHTSGLPREVPCGPSFSSQRKNICPVNTTYVYQQLGHTELKFAPGTAVGYSNLGYALLTHALFERFGDGYSSWKEWISAQLLSPLGMSKTVLNDHRFVPNTAVNYKDNGLITPKIDWGWSSPSFQMSTSTSDLTKLMTALVDSKNSFFHKNIIQEMFKPVFVFHDYHTIFSSGWQIHNHNSLRVITKAGAIPGSSAAIFFIPDVKFGFILLATGQEIAATLAEKISMKISEAFLSSSISLTPEIKPAENPSLYIGDYILNNQWSDQVRAIISFEPFYRHLKLQQEPGYPKVVYLSFKTSQLLQIVYPRGLSCQAYAVGQDKELLQFSHPDSTGKWQQFTLGSFLFRRVS